MTPTPQRQHIAILAAIAWLSAMPAQAQTPPPAAPAATIRFQLPAQPLDQALAVFARQAGLQLAASPDLLRGLQGQAISGALTAQAALAQLLHGSGLRGQIDQGLLTIVRADPQGEAAITLPTVRVKASAIRETATGPVSGYMARRSATATKTDTAIAEVPQSISVIGREELDARGVQDLMQAVHYTPGVTTDTYGPDNRGWEYVLLRGFEASVSGSYRDALGQPTALVAYYLTEPYGLERVEVLRGPSSMAFGKGNAGGIVNRVSKQPGDRIREIELQYGSFQRQQLGFDLGDQLGDGGSLSYRLVGTGLDSNDQDKYPDGHKLNHTRSYIAPSLRWQPDATTSLTVLGEYLRNTTAEDPYYASTNNVPSQVKVGDYSFSHMAQTQSAIGYRLETALNRHWTLRQNFRHSRIDMQRRVVWADALEADGHTLSRIARTWDDAVNLTTLDSHVQGEMQQGPIRHTVLLGVDHSDQKARGRRFIGPAPALDLLAPVYGQAVALPTQPLGNLDLATRQTGLYAQDQARFGERWLLTVGGRQDRVRQTTDDHLASSRSRQSDHAFSGRLGLSHLAGNGWVPYISLVTSFEPNTGVDASGSPFVPSRGKQVEVGVKFQPAGARALFNAAVFDLRKTNVVTYDPTTYEGRQIGKQRSRGIELEAKGQLAPGLNIAAAYTWLDMQVLASADAGEVGKIPPLVPRQSASLWLDRSLGNGLGFGAGLRHIGERQNDEYNTGSESAVTLLDAALHYDSGPWRFALNITNLANKTYYTVCYHGECYQGAQRTLTGSARYRF